MRILVLFFLTVTITLFQSCVAYQLPIQRSTIIAEKPEVDIQRDGTGIIRTAHCDISARYISADDWNKVISSSHVFANSGKSVPHPPYDIFFITLQNSTSNTIKDLRFYIKTPLSSETSLSIGELADESAPSSFSGTDITDIFSLRRLLITDYILDDIDFDRNSIGYPFPFILPHERGSLFVAFRIPAFEYRRYILSVEYVTGEIKKVVDFEVVRKENRPE
ncbi:MAG TPA: hypothetical protein PKK43_00590 [Spirochaetota bacterium]|nr:hypothetical protein [Spirochaetota bacterium]